MIDGARKAQTLAERSDDGIAGRIAARRQRKQHGLALDVGDVELEPGAAHAGLELHATRADRWGDKLPKNFW